MAHRRRPRGRPRRDISKHPQTRRAQIPAREMRLRGQTGKFARRWRLPVLIGLIAFIILVCDPASFGYVLAGVAVIYIMLSLYRRTRRNRPGEPVHR